MWLLFTLSAEFTPTRAHGQSASLDSTFAPALQSGAAVYHVLDRPDGHILIGGRFYASSPALVAHVARLNPDGSVDPTFNPGAVADGRDSYVDALAVQTDGKIVIGGSFTSTRQIAPANLARLNADGTVDPGFNPDLYIDGPVNAILMQPDGKILIAGGFDIVDRTIRRRLARLHSDGTVDPEFDACVAATADDGGTSLALQDDGQILASGSFTFASGTFRDGIARLSSCGVLDTSYGSELEVDAGAVVYATALRSTGEVVVGGNFRSFHEVNRSGLLQLDTQGAVETTFNPGSGINVGSAVYSIALDKDGKALIGGVFNQYDGRTRVNLARVNLDGSLDAEFDPGPGPNDIVSSLAIQSDGRILVAGRFNSFNGRDAPGLARIRTDRPRFARPFQSEHGQFEAMFYGINLATYRIQASTNLLDWIPVTNLTVRSIPTLFVDPTFSSSVRRFYRAELSP